MVYYAIYGVPVTRKTTTPVEKKSELVFSANGESANAERWVYGNLDLDDLFRKPPFWLFVAPLASRESRLGISSHRSAVVVPPIHIE